MGGGIIIPGDYDDWRWAGSGVNPPGYPAPAVLTQYFSGPWLWSFADGSTMAFPDQQIPHDYAEGTDIVPHIHWVPKAGGIYTGVWTLTFYGWLSAAQGTAEEAPLVLTAAFDGSVNTGEVQTQNFSAVIPGLNRKISSMASLTLSLAQTAGDACGLVGLDGHYLKDRLGSKLITTK